MTKVIIDANQSIFKLNLRELFSYKDLFYTLAYRDFKIKYAQTFLGIVWAFIQPALTLMVFGLLFSRGLNIGTGEVPYLLYAGCGLATWTYFAAVMGQAGNSIIAAQNIVQKIYFPRLIIPLSKALVGLIDFAIALGLVFILALFYKFKLSPNVVFLPFFILLTIVSSLGVGIWLSALSIRYRDFQQVIPFLVRFGMFFTPVAYPPDIIIKKIPQWGAIIYYLNPVAGLIEGVRWCVLGTSPPVFLSYISFAMIFLLFVSSLFYFKKVEKVIADIV